MKRKKTVNESFDDDEISQTQWREGQRELWKRRVEEFFPNEQLGEFPSAPALCSFSLGVSFASEILAQGPVAVAAAKCAMREGLHRDLAGAMEVEAAGYQKVLHTDDRVEALKAFGEKRKPNFKGQ
eukprot:GHVT01081544.1.p2 GENE.GHVT01081544.1~~GHVT01081544.1.p2  ORF type:complete len:126 (-),score=36.04 GHVT01081544.1:936-1313(-)